MIGAILGFLGGPLINGAISAYREKLAAGNTQDRMAVDLAERELTVQQRERELQTQVLIAEQGHWATRWVRPIWAAPFVFFTWKIIVWDKMLGWGKTDPLDPNMWAVFMLMVGAYFGGRSAEKVATTIAGAFGKRRA